MQSSSANIYEGMFFPKSSLNSIVLSVHEMSSLLLDILQSSVSGIIAKWKCLRNTETQPWSQRPHRVIVLRHWLLRHIVWEIFQQSADSVTAESQTSCGINISSELCAASFKAWLNGSCRCHMKVTHNFCLYAVGFFFLVLSCYIFCFPPNVEAGQQNERRICLTLVQFWKTKVFCVTHCFP